MAGPAYLERRRAVWGGWSRVPQARRWIATEEFWVGGDFVRRGSAHDVDDAVVKRAPQYFRPTIEPDEAA